MYNIYHCAQYTYYLESMLLLNTSVLTVLYIGFGRNDNTSTIFTKVCVGARRLVPVEYRTAIRYTYNVQKIIRNISKTDIITLFMIILYISILYTKISTEYWLYLFRQFLKKMLLLNSRLYVYDRRHVRLAKYK